ncbi:hypothetical protein [Sphingomonas lenta]|uniref:Uncharacterized protein n=1 Tax=Sphingomonas lenta TaxID=1141887 RepID=A0A2A2SGZ7_9SPHN|nr:hypothetical protein [Sphingomonas lenta]PAX08482.1 hypothetical protein CKY28_03580 [Sphingomonas lenta]
MVGVLAALLLAGCGEDRATTNTASAGAKLEAAAIEAGLVPDPERATLIGSWAADSDRVCVAPGEGGRDRIGVLLDYGEGNGCVAAGGVRRAGDRLDVDFGRCRVQARFDGERISFPASVPQDCERLCRGNATLSALSVARVSDSAAEAATLRTPSGRLLCAD